MTVPELVRTHSFIDVKRVAGYVYYQLPKAMLAHGDKVGVSPNEAILYTILRGRLDLNDVESGVDKNGHVFVICPRIEISACTGWSTHKTIQVFRNLVKSGLLREEATVTASGGNGPKKLFLKQWMVPSMEYDFTMEEFLDKKFPPLTLKTKDTICGECYILPKLLIESDLYQELSIRAKLLYMVILDEMSFSAQYGRIDENGLLWTTLDGNKLPQILGCSKRSVSTAYKELTDSGLIFRKRAEFTEKYRIYARDFVPQPRRNMASLDFQ